MQNKIIDDYIHRLPCNQRRYARAYRTWLLTGQKGSAPNPFGFQLSGFETSLIKKVIENGTIQEARYAKTKSA